MFSELLQHILDNNPYLNNGFDDVVLDQVTGIVHNSEPVFPSDELGNYFYLRLPNNIRFDYSTYFNVSECDNSPGKVYDVILVACVKDANANELLNNLLSSTSSFHDNIQFTSATTQSEVVINQELSGMEAVDREAALKRKPEDMTIVSISFTYTEQSGLTKCIEEPCANC